MFTADVVNMGGGGTIFIIHLPFKRCEMIHHVPIFIPENRV